MGGNYIIFIKENTYFAGWGIFGEMKTIGNRDLAYRFSRPLAERNLPKLVQEFGTECKIEALKEGIAV